MKYLLEDIQLIEKSDYILNFNKKINLKERFFFNFLFKTSLKNKKIILELKEEFFYNELHEEKIERFLNLFFEKKIIITNKKGELLGIINPISCFFREEEKYIFFISERIYDYFITNENLALKYKLDMLFKIDNDNIKNFYIFLLNEFSKSNEIILNKKEIKNILGITNGYNRFFDLEKKFIFPTLKLIKEFFNININYNKIKGTAAINSKILNLKFTLPILKNTTEENQKLLTLLKPYVKKEETIFFILETLTKKSSTYIEKNILYSIEHFQNNFDKFLIEAINFNYAENRFNNLLEIKQKSAILIVQCNDLFSNFKSFQNKLKEFITQNSNDDVKETLLLYTTFKEIIIDSYEKMTKNKKNNFLYDHNILLTQLEILSKYKEFHYEDKTYIYLAEYNSFQESKIYILKKDLFI